MRGEIRIASHPELFVLVLGEKQAESFGEISGSSNQQEL